MSPFSLHDLRIGVTQRRLPATTTTHERDALDAVWSDWFAEYLPEESFLGIPNFRQPKQAAGYVEKWRLNALILSGGEDIGSSPARDAMEKRLLDHARHKRMPVLGICRGMQALHSYAGGELVAHPGHIGAPHRVFAGEHTMTVNSWHRFAILSPHPDWNVLAMAEDGSIEAMQHASLPWLGLMWHPERELGVPSPTLQWIANILSFS